MSHPAWGPYNEGAGTSKGFARVEFAWGSDDGGVEEGWAWVEEARCQAVVGFGGAWGSEGGGVTEAWPGLGEPRCQAAWGLGGAWGSEREGVGEGWLWWVEEARCVAVGVLMLCYYGKQVLKKMRTVLLTLFATARSGLPSSFRSATAIEVGPGPVE